MRTLTEIQLPKRDRVYVVSLYGVNGNGRDLALRAGIIFHFIRLYSVVYKESTININIDKIILPEKSWRLISTLTHPFFLRTLVDCHDLVL